ncbi:hypothetical protein PMAYCL1PPCAC_05526, partial [Pristionchus mayeri]
VHALHLRAASTDCDGKQGRRRLALSSSHALSLSLSLIYRSAKRFTRPAFSLRSSPRERRRTRCRCVVPSSGAISRPICRT